MKVTVIDGDGPDRTETEFRRISAIGIGHTAKDLVLVPYIERGDGQPWPTTQNEFLARADRLVGTAIEVAWTKLQVEKEVGE